MKKIDLKRCNIINTLLFMTVFFIPYTKFRIVGLKISEILMMLLIILKLVSNKIKINKKEDAGLAVIAFSIVITSSAILSFFDPINQYTYGQAGSIFYSFEYGWVLKIVRLIIVFLFMQSVMDFCKTESKLRLICSIYVSSNVIVDFIVIGKRITQSDLVIGVTRTAAMAVEPAEAGFINSMAIIYAAFLFLSSEKRRERKIAIVSACVLIIGQLVIGSTGSLVAVGPAAAIAACVYLKKKKEKAGVKLLEFGTIALIGICALIFLVEKTSVFSKISRYKVYLEIPGSSVAERLGAITTCLAMFRERPLLGVGFGNYGWYIDHFITTNLYYYAPGGAFQPNNQYFQLLAELGIVGFVIYSIFVLKVFQSIVKVIRRKTQRSLLYGTFSLCMWIYLMIHNMTLPTLFSFQFWMVCAFVEQTTRIRKYD